jgi:hypothetical protein
MEAVLFSWQRDHRLPTSHTVSVGTHVVPYNPTAIRWLSYWMDPRLTFNHHHQKWLTKAKRQQARIARLCCQQGLPPASAANLQKAIVQSVATYGVELNATRRLPSRDVGRLASLQLVVNQQARVATGCLRTTPIGFLMAEGGTCPAEAIVRGREARFRARILSRPPPPASTSFRKPTPTEDTIRHLTRRAATRCGFSAVEPVEKSAPDRHNPGTVIIAPRAEAELTARKWRDLDAACIWTDGSRLEGHTGACYMRAVRGNLVASEFYLGTHTEVFDAELFVIYVALREFWNSGEAGKVSNKIVIFSDAHAALHRLRTDDAGPGQCIGR